MKKIPFPKRKPLKPDNSWEAGFGKLMTPLEQFIKGETNSGILLVICTALALCIANSDLYHIYEQILATYWSIGSENIGIKMSLHHWINDGLMTLFFFLVGLEIKREVMVGELSDLRNALLPICAAVGGMAMPALFYASFNMSGAGFDGWGIPMATDIAFAVTALVLLGSRCPKPLMTFLIALAIVDDIGAVLIIAVFYTNTLDINALLIAGAIFSSMVLLNFINVRRSIVYLIFGAALWVALHASGIHATLAGILAALTIPAKPRYKASLLLDGTQELLRQFDEARNSDKNVLSNAKMAGILETLKAGIRRAQTPLQTLESQHHIPVNFIVIPLFALANAAIPIDVATLGHVAKEPVTLGIIVGLVLGKPVGITLSAWIAIKLGICNLPSGVTMRHVVGAGFLAGIGFTMSIFIAELAFPGDKLLLLEAKTGILFASIIAGFIGFAYLWVIGKQTPQE